MNYRRIHDKLIARARNRPLRGYREVHHVKPRCLGGADDEANLVSLTYREHFLVHWLLTKFHFGNERRLLCFALARMATPIGERVLLSWQASVVARARRQAGDLTVIRGALGDNLSLIRPSNVHNVRRHVTRTIRFSADKFVAGMSRREREDKLASMASLLLRFSK